jgi:CBS domain-containing protein
MLTVADIMTQPVITIRGSATIATAIQRLIDHSIHSLIVDRNHAHDAYGILTHTDIVTKVIAYGIDPDQVRVYEVMTKPCIVINPDLGLEYLARLFANTGIHCAPVIQAELLGMVSSTDILKHAPRIQKPLNNVLMEEFERLLNIAQQTCAQHGADSPECIRAWAAVDAIQTEAAHNRSQHLESTAFETFREQNPEVLTAQDYELWCSG